MLEEVVDFLIERKENFEKRLRRNVRKITIEDVNNNSNKKMLE